MPMRSVELHRKSIHLIGLMPPIIYLLTNKLIIAIIVLFFLSLFILIELYRFKYGIPIKKVEIVAKPLMRSHEEYGIAGHVYYAAGVFVAILAFDKDIAIMAMLVLSLADSAAAIVGERWGKHRLLGKKTLEGSLTLFCVAFVTVAGVSLKMALVGAIAATVIELFPLNDNLTIPIFVGFLMTVARYIG